MPFLSCFQGALNAQPRRNKAGLMYNFTQLKLAVPDTHMEAEQLNLIGNRLADLAERQHALRGYL